MIDYLLITAVWSPWQSVRELRCVPIDTSQQMSSHDTQHTSWGNYTDPFGFYHHLRHSGAHAAAISSVAD